MKKFFFAVLAGMMALVAVAQNGDFKLEASLDGFGKSVMLYLTDAKGDVNDYGIKSVTDNRLDYSFNMDDVGYMIIVVNPSLSITIPAVPGEYVNLRGKVNDYVIEGSSLYKAYGEAMAGLKPFIDASLQFDFKKYCQNEMAGKSSEELFYLYQNHHQRLSRPITDAALSYIREHPNQDVSMMILNQMGNLSDLETVASIVDVSVRDGRMKPYLEARKEQVQKTGFSNPLLDKLAIDFLLNDVDGVPLSLRSLHGKWVLLNFWNTTCGNAVYQFSELKELYDKYRDYIEIVGIDCGDDKEAWTIAVKSRYNLPWKNVNNLCDGDDSSDLFTLYGVTGLPTYFLITPSGKVVMESYAAHDAKYIFELLFD